MKKGRRAELILDEGFAVSNRYRVLLKVYRVTPGKKFPLGIKARFVMVDSETELPRLLVGSQNMKTSKALYIQFESWSDFKARVKTDLRKQIPTKGKADTLLFNSVADYQKFMTEQKLAIVAAIIHKKPSSIYQLAQLVERDVANVQRDCVALEAMGFITLKDSGDAKKSKRPKLPFNYQKIVVCMPKVTYTHDFEEAA